MLQKWKKQLTTEHAPGWKFRPGLPRKVPMLACLVVSALSDSCGPVDCSLPGSTFHADSLGKNTGVDCHALLQGIFPTQGSKHQSPESPALQADSLTLSHQGGLQGNLEGSWQRLGKGRWSREKTVQIK